MPFVKGQSGNISGRPKAADEFRVRCRKLVDEKVVDYWQRELENDGPNAMKASELLSAYAYGKPSQAVELSGKDGGPITVTWQPPATS